MIARRLRAGATALALAVSALTVAWGNPDAGFPVSPEVHDDGRVTVRVKAPKAERVQLKGSLPRQVEGGKGSVDLQRSADDPSLWEVTIGPAAPGIHDYRFDVDGTLVLDPHNRWFKKWRASANLVEVPGDPPLITERQRIPHGSVTRHSWFSQVLDEHREVFVYTPPGYDPKRATPYPVLFLLHGSGDGAEGWTEVGRAHLIADNLIATGALEPLVIVMPYGHGALPGIDQRALEDRSEWSAANNAAVERDFFETTVPEAQRHYHLSDDADQRAIAGLSMGGGQALTFGLQHPEQFRWVAGFSSGVPSEPERRNALLDGIPDPAEFSKVWVACGRSDFLLDRNEALHAALQQRGIDHEYTLTEGGHSWPVWRDYLETWLRQLFR